MNTNYKILVINGPNMNLLGKRNIEIYGTKTYKDLVDYITNFCSEISNELSINITCEFFQSNHEGDIVDALQKAGGYVVDMNEDKIIGQKFDAIILNAAAYTHYSIAIRDAVESIDVPVVEVHMSDVDKREKFRQIFVIRDVCEFCVAGLGFDSYTQAIKKLLIDNNR